MAHLWKLKSGHDRRFRSGHPWVYSNELSESPKGISPGDAVELRDASGKFLARGYGNPHSLIAFRALSRHESDTAPCDDAAIALKLQAAERLREVLGIGDVSHRLCFGEGDGLPGLVIDRYRLDPDGRSLVVIQPHTAGAERWVAGIVKRYALQGCAVMVRRDINVRSREGIAVIDEPELHGIRREELQGAVIRVGGARFEVNLYDGQKTGFFLDQAQNIELASRLASGLTAGATDGGVVRVLDLCCYVGQWGVQLGSHLKSRGRRVEVTAVDASAQALEYASRNLVRAGVEVRTLKRDVVHELTDLPDAFYDVVICDPPALVKSRKDLAVGAHAYTTLNTQALRLTRAGGLFVSCSCSALLEDGHFLEVLAKAERRSGREVRWVASGGQSFDHPESLAFPEGHYLKARFGWVSR